MQYILSTTDRSYGYVCLLPCRRVFCFAYHSCHSYMSNPIGYFIDGAWTFLETRKSCESSKTIVHFFKINQTFQHSLFTCL